MNVSFIYQNKFYEYCFNIDYIIFFINHIFFNLIIKKINDKFHIDIKKISFIKIHDLNINEYNICEYAIIYIYIFNKNNDKIVLIRREIHIMNNFFAKILININIMKFKEVVLDINKNFIIIEFYNLL